MNEPLHDIDKLFHDNIEGHSEYPPKKVWDKIEAGLDKDTASAYKRKYKTIKRAAVILLILFLGVLIYEVVNRHPGKGDVAGKDKKNEQQGNVTIQKDDKVNNSSKKDNTDAISQEQSKNNQPGEGPDNSISEEKKSTGIDQSPVVSAIDAKKTNNNDRQKEILNTALKQNDRAAVVKNDDNSSKQKIKNRLTQNNSIDLSVTAPGKSKTGKDNFSVTTNTTSSLAPVAKEGDLTTKEEQIKRLPFFTLTPVGPWKKNIATGTNLEVNIPEKGPASILGQLANTVTKKSANPVFRNYGFSLALFFSPNAAWNSLQDDKPYRPSGGGGSGGGGGRPVDHDEIRKSEQNSFAYSGGIKLSYGFNKKISLQTGLNYTKSSTSLGSKEVYAERDNNGDIRYRVDCSSGYTFVPPHSGSNPSPGDRITMTDNKNTLSYLGIPLAVEYRISFGKFSLSPSAGGQVNILLKGKTTAVLGKGTSNETAASGNTEGLKSSYFSALTGITGELLVNKKLSLTIAPAGQFGLSPINNGASVKTRPNYFGLAAGIKLKL